MFIPLVHVDLAGTHAANYFPAARSVLCLLMIKNYQLIFPEEPLSEYFRMDHSNRVAGSTVGGGKMFQVTIARILQ